jgi:hypothetical protein
MCAAHGLRRQQETRDRGVGRGEPVRVVERHASVKARQPPSRRHATGGRQADGGSWRNTGGPRIGASVQLRVKASHAFEHRLTSVLFKARTSDALDDPISPCANASTRA